MKEENLIIVKQLPVIEEQLVTIKRQIEERVTAALAMPCTEETIKQVKAVRADLSKDFRELEERRKEVKRKILSPYEQFERVYKSCVTDIFQPADNQLKQKINEVEEGLKEQKRAEIAAYFSEYAATKGIDFLAFEQSGISVTLSASKKSLKEQAKARLDKVSDELSLIDKQEHPAEILVEYKKTLNAAEAITTVAARHQAIEEERQWAGQREAPEAARNVEQEILPAPIAEPAPTIFASASEIFEVFFSVRGTLEKLKELKQYLMNGGYDFEQR